MTEQPKPKPWFRVKIMLF